MCSNLVASLTPGFHSNDISDSCGFIKLQSNANTVNFYASFNSRQTGFWSSIRIIEAFLKLIW
jgi:hypothetical protein